MAEPRLVFQLPEIDLRLFDTQKWFIKSRHAFPKMSHHIMTIWCAFAHFYFFVSALTTIPTISIPVLAHTHTHALPYRIRLLDLAPVLIAVGHQHLTVRQSVWQNAAKELANRLNKSSSSSLSIG
jgi:branched-subunit amino acid permease